MFVIWGCFSICEGLQNSRFISPPEAFIHMAQWKWKNVPHNKWIEMCFLAPCLWIWVMLNHNQPWGWLKRQLQVVSWKRGQSSMCKVALCNTYPPTIFCSPPSGRPLTTPHILRQFMRKGWWALNSTSVAANILPNNLLMHFLIVKVASCKVVEKRSFTSDTLQKRCGWARRG